jgi:hypothetical protein
LITIIATTVVVRRSIIGTRIVTTIVITRRCGIVCGTIRGLAAICGGRICAVCREMHFHLILFIFIHFL